MNEVLNCRAGGATGRLKSNIVIQVSRRSALSLRSWPGSGDEQGKELDDWSVGTTEVHGSLGTTAGDGIWTGT